MDSVGGPNHGTYYTPPNFNNSEHHQDVSGQNTIQTQALPVKNTVKRQQRASSSNRSTPAAGSDTRFQCSKCSKSFSRIENLTRHQANHEDIGKFVCPVCRKRFTRSDLLNRHRKIHGVQVDGSGIRVEATHSPGPPDIKPQLDRQDDTGHEPLMAGMPFIAGALPSQQYRHIFPDPNRQNPTYQNGDSNSMQPPLAPDRRLTSLMEAALTPHQFTPAENVNPTSWDGFTGFGDSGSSLMGSYDADISWTLDPFSTGPSSTYSSENDPFNRLEDFSELPFEIQSFTNDRPPDNPLDGDENEDDETSDWPDKISREDATRRRISRIVPRLLPTSWQLVLLEARASGLTAATIPPPQHITGSLRQNLINALNGANGQYEFSRPQISDAMFPPAEALDFFLRLYIQSIHPRFPILHLSTFDMYTSPPLLLVAMMFLGSSHSNSDRGRFSRLFHGHLRVSCIKLQEINHQFLRSVDNIFTFFLLCLAGTWSGNKEAYEFAEGARGVLVTACRRLRLLDQRPPSQLDTLHFQGVGFGPLESTWRAWIELEKRKRLGLSIYVFDCQYPALFNNQSYVGKAETTTCVLPCDEEFWDAPTANTWKKIVGVTELPEPLYYLRALNGVLLHRYVKPAPPIVPIRSEFAKLLLVYAFHTHIFDWRQAAAMLNPTGLLDIEPPYDLGNSLRERRKWLLDALGSWAECYQDEHTSTAALLLHRLAYISLDVSLSDMHLAAGRSNNTNDSNFAEENLKSWANSEIANSTMSHVYSMLQLCHSCIQSNMVADASYEVAVCLFTGGIICWAYSRLKTDAPKEQCMAQVHKASLGLKEMGCWKMCLVFGRILNGFRAN